MRSALLCGRHHHELGNVGLVAEGPAAISISKGGAQKTYSHVDPNEDAAGFAIGSGGCLIAVADGHEGASGAEVAVAVLLERFAATWTRDAPLVTAPEAWSEIACEALAELNAAVLREAAERKASAAPTTLSFALVRSGENAILHASIGDSHVFQHREQTQDLGWQTLGRNRAYFLGYESQGPQGFREKTVIGSEPLEGTRALVLATDGVSERSIGFADPARVVGDLVATVARAEEHALRPSHLSRSLTEAAMAEQRRNRAGDNIANAVLWLEK